MQNKDVRWEQRFSNYRKALAKLEQAVEDEDSLSELEKDGMIQRFEYTFELAWKTLQDLLEYKGYIDITGPNPSLEQSLKDGYIKDENCWRRMKKSRELTSHTYDCDTTENISKDIVEKYYPLLKELEARLKLEPNEKQKAADVDISTDGKKIVTRNIPPARENQNDRFRVQYGNPVDFEILEVNITRLLDGEAQRFMFNAHELPESGSIHFSTEVVNGKMNVIWLKLKPNKE